jgi:hypothetical protein
MSDTREHRPQNFRNELPGTQRRQVSPGKVTLTSRVPGPGARAAEPRKGVSVQRKGLTEADRAGAARWETAALLGLAPLASNVPVQQYGDGMQSSDETHQLAAEGISGPATALPHLEQIQRSFAQHDVSEVKAHIGGPAAQASQGMGARAYATGDHVAFREEPDLHTAAHEAAHVVQQRAGVQLSGGVGEVGDGYERNADAVADRVVQGRSAASLLGQMAPARGGHASTAIQKFESDEHARIGDNAAKDASGKVAHVELAPGYSIPYGDMVAMGGDYFTNIDEMRRMAAKPGPGAGTREEIEYVRAVKVRGITGGSYSKAAIDAVDARYYRLAANNRSHFHNATRADTSQTVAEQAGQAPDPEQDTTVLGIRLPPSPKNAIEGYRYYHVRALAEAARAAAAGQSVDAALATEAFGAHYLTDSFSAGHVRTERQSIKAHWDGKIPMFFYNLKGFMAEQIAIRVAAGMRVGPWQVREDIAYEPPLGEGAKQIIAKKLDAIGPLGFGDLVSGAIHDYDNEHGIVATSAGATVTLYGDGKAGKGDEERLATEAARTGIAELRQAFTNGAAMTAQDVINTTLGSDGLFAPERMIPEAKPDTAQGAGQGKTKWDYADIEELLADAQFVAGARIFAAEKAAVMREVAASFDATKRAAVEDGVVKPLTSDPIGTLRMVINWTPTLSDSLLGHNTDDHSNDYWKEAKNTPGGLRSLTYVQRERLISRLLDGATVGDDEDAIMDILKTAPDADARKLIKKFGWKRLYDKIDDGFGEDFKDTFSKAKYG